MSLLSESEHVLLGGLIMSKVEHVKCSAQSPLAGQSSAPGPYRSVSFRQLTGQSSVTARQKQVPGLTLTRLTRGCLIKGLTIQLISVY
jgi:hypothetical protein